MAEGSFLFWKGEKTFGYMSRLAQQAVAPLLYESFTHSQGKVLVGQAPSSRGLALPNLRIIANCPFVLPYIQHSANVVLPPPTATSMADNVGLSTPRGSGTSGYVQKNRSLLRPRDKAAPYPKEWDQAKHRPRQPDAAILEHEAKREIEVKVLELRDRLEEEGCVMSPNCVVVVVRPHSPSARLIHESGLMKMKSKSNAKACGVNSSRSDRMVKTWVPTQSD